MLEDLAVRLLHVLVAGEPGPLMDADGSEPDSGLAIQLSQPAATHESRFAQYDSIRVLVPWIAWRQALEAIVGVGEESSPVVGVEFGADGVPAQPVGDLDCGIGAAPASATVRAKRAGCFRMASILFRKAGVRGSEHPEVDPKRRTAIVQLASLTATLSEGRRVGFPPSSLARSRHPGTAAGPSQVTPSQDQRRHDRHNGHHTLVQVHTQELGHVRLEILQAESQ